MSELKKNLGFSDDGTVDKEFKLPIPGVHIIEATEGIKIFTAGEYEKINIPFVCSECDIEAGNKFSVQIFIGGDYQEAASKTLGCILVAANADDKFFAGFAKPERQKKLGVLITEKNFKKVLDPAIAPTTVEALNILLPGQQFAVKLNVTKGDFQKVIFTKYAIKGTPGYTALLKEQTGISSVPITKTNISPGSSDNTEEDYVPF